MKKKLLLTVFMLFITLGYGQTEKAWAPIQGKSVEKNKNVERDDFPQDFVLMKLDLNLLKTALLNVPNRFSKSRKGIVISLPNSNGVLERFEMFEASNFDAELQSRFPEIRAYAGIGLDDKYAQVRLSISPSGIQTMTFRADRRSEFMESYSQDNTILCLVQFRLQRPV